MIMKDWRQPFRSIGPVAAALVLFASSAFAQIEIAEELLVDLSAEDPTAGEDLWANAGTLGDFMRVGQPALVDIDGVLALSFNEFGTFDAYQSAENAPASIVGLDATRSIEVWVHNTTINVEETLVSWGRRGGPDGTNMSFNYGTSPAFGAVGHWGAPDLGWGAAAPSAGVWHHLVYTYDGTTTRVYADGVLANQEVLGAGVINTHSGTKITVAAQTEPDGVALNQALPGTLSIARVRVHAGVLSDEQVTENYLAEADFFGVVPTAPFVTDPPADDEVVAGSTYSRNIFVEGFPFPDVMLVEPAGGSIEKLSPREFRVSFDVPSTGPDFIDVVVRASNAEGQEDITWRVSIRRIPQAGEIAVAGELFVLLDAKNPSAGTEFWENEGSLGDFARVGAPVVAEIAGGTAVSFNLDGRSGDAYQSLDLPPLGLVGLDPTRTIEVWAYNPTIAAEETLVSWGRRGGGAGTNMSFNYGSNELFGAVGHWDFPDLGWGPVVPREGAWHHLVYTYDGTTTRVYADGQLANFEELGEGVINTHPDTSIVIAAQIEPDGLTLNTPLGGSLYIGRVRVHDGVLSPEEVLHNYEEEIAEFTSPDTPPDFASDVPTDAFIFQTTDVYEHHFRVSGVPDPAAEVLEPAGATVSQTGNLSWALTYDVPAPAPSSFQVRVRISNSGGSMEVSWPVEVRPLPAISDPIETAGELFVELDAYHATAGTDFWENTGTLDDFVRVGFPELVEHDGAPAVAFNVIAAGDAYESLDIAPAGLVGTDPTRSIEVWTFNPDVQPEETLVAWGHRGGPAGTNMSFNYGNHFVWGAVGHWDAPDLGWGDIVPLPGQWNHLVYTYDGTTTRVYVNGELANQEFLGFGVVNTYAETKIALTQQYLADGINFEFGPISGNLSIGRVRIHDGVLLPEQIAHNHAKERSEFPLPTPIQPEPLTIAPVHRYRFSGNADDSIGDAHGVAIGDVLFEDGQAVLLNDGSQNSNATGASPPAPPPGAYIDLPNGLISTLGETLTIEIWTTWNGPSGQAWQRIFDFGTSTGGEEVSNGGETSGYLFLTPWTGDTTTRVGYKSATAGEQSLNGSTLTIGVEHHIVIVWDETAFRSALYIDGIKIDEDPAVPFSLSELIDVNNWLGRSQWADPMYNGSYNELRLYDYVLTDGQVVGNFLAGPDTLNGIDSGEPRFLRGDADASGALNLTDGIRILSYLFAGGVEVNCLDAADADDSGSLNLTDGIYVLNYLFVGESPAPPMPFPECGPDPTDDSVTCETEQPNCAI